MIIFLDYNTDPNKNASFGGLHRLYHYVKQDGKYKISQNHVKDWLSGIYAYVCAIVKMKGEMCLSICVGILSNFANVIPLKTI